MINISERSAKCGIVQNPLNIHKCHIMLRCSLNILYDFRHKQPSFAYM